ncbi:unnamed protein product [Diabrotica balteata]|uniref:Phosphatidic acid phosphatase type 2/haloperoxidase domain-containing protein n=1 Tax=Diabrotica balteata TaxID=107213 RepID=A0A9N9SSE2_DIABA|nr:unnamed protein product [Diabrotica balteata]
MGVILSILGLVEPKLSLRPQKVVVGTVYGVQLTLAYLLNLLVSSFAVLMIVLLEFGTIPAVQQGFYCGDPLISHKYTGDTIHPVTLGLTAPALVIVMVLVTELLAHQSFRQINWHAVVFYVSEATVGATLTLLVTSIGKVLVGEHRPHFLTTCQPDTAENCSIGTFIETFTCKSTEFAPSFLVDSSLSFPSGHSSIAWYIGIFSAYVVHVRMTTVNSGYIMRPFLISFCLTWSMVCSLSRITDRRHHWWDVLAGTVLGIVFAAYTIKVMHEKIKENNVPICSICLEREVPFSGNGVNSRTNVGFEL